MRKLRLGGLRKLLALIALGGYSPGLINTAPSFNSDIEAFIQEEVLTLSRRQLIAYQFGKMLTLPQNRGTTYTASRYIRLNLPYAPLQEGVAPVGEAMTLQQVSATAQQWGDRVIITDVAELTIKHPLFEQAIQLVGLQIPETLERNVLNALMGGVNINYAGGVASRAGLSAANVLSPHESNRILGSLLTFGAPRFNGDENIDEYIDPDVRKGSDQAPNAQPHYIGLLHPLVAQDMRENATIATAWSYSAINRLYNNELGEWGGVRWCESNMIPYFVGVAAINGTAQTVGGALTTATYYIQVTASPALTSVEQQIYQISSSISITGPTGAITVALPSLPNYVFNVYISTSSTMAGAALGLCPQGPTTGPLAGQATQLAGNQTVTITGTGTTQAPPAAPTTGVTVFPTFFIARESYGQVKLDDVEIHFLNQADKSDPINQTRVVSWKVFYGTILLNQNFFARCESSSAFAVSYQAGNPTTG